MSRQLASHNDDIRRLIEKGFAVSEDSNYLVVRDIPYLDANLELATGAFVTTLVAIDEHRVRQDDHQVWFAGGVPHGLDAKPIPNLGGGPCSLHLSPAASDVVVERRFSNKPLVAQRFADFFEKIESYTNIIAGPAMERYGASPYTFRVPDEVAKDPIFKFRDTLTSRGELTDLTACFHGEVVAVIGLGGTGSYVLDFMVKTPVAEVRAFDADRFHVHNAFRSPGHVDPSEFDKTKAEVCLARYSNFRDGFSAKATYIDGSSDDELSGVTFAFVCVDQGASRVEIFQALVERKIPFIDVGMGLKRKDQGLGGMVRVTYFPSEHSEEVMRKSHAPLQDDPEDLYRAKVQIGELNALNAALAVTRYKQLRGFYKDASDWENLLFDTTDLKSVGVSTLED
ncbi:ThiF family adenylyltransferase [Celeribacter sp. SCSIO 80788]|uniref:ThiF family adenylyltransferase n=1 Tax=Celeribacter sp. SCSIO 80788 TaxID=3117013 RepID=UPI003DA57CF6